MAIKQKSPERLKAQVATFASERVRSNEDRLHIIRNAGEIALGELKDINWVREGSELANNEIIYTEENRTAATPKDYVDFLRNRTKHEQRMMQEKTAMYEAYADFAPLVDSLIASLPDDRYDQSEHPDFVGDGTYSSVFSINKDGRRYAVRVPVRDPASEVDYHMNRAILGKGLSHFEQIIAVSPETGVTVAEIMPGKQFDNLLPEDLRKVTDEQLEELIDTLDTAAEHDIAIDANGGNIFYDPDEGFGFIDYHPQQVQGRPAHPQSKGMMLALVADVLGNPGDHAVYASEDVSEDQYANLLDLEKAQLDILERINSIASKKLGFEDLSVAQSGTVKITGLNREIQELKAKITEHSDPARVAAMVEDAKRTFKEMSERKPTKLGMTGWTKV